MPGSSDFGDFGNDDEEDRKPSVEYLDSLNDYRKRSRSREDEGSTKTKIARVGEVLNGYDYSPDSGITPVEENVVMVEDVVPPPEDDPLVYGACPIFYSDYDSYLQNPSEWESCSLFKGDGRGS
jgi:transcription initiation factor TFIIE subunit alpha